ncbi:hypothetical protein P8X24_09810 [Pyrococcus kukulkanii]|uniref:hypothetical protein n=1 Tax=Pyrococcus kukulkanii TaxID=1609559 RepID=UPI0035636E84
MAITTFAQAMEGAYYGYKLGKDILDDFRRSSKLPLGKDIYVTFVLVTIFKERSWPKFKEVEDEVIKVLHKYNFNKSKGTLTLDISGRKVECAVEYQIKTNFLLPFDESIFPISGEDYEDLAEEIYDLAIATDLTVFIIPDLRKLSKEESKRVMRDILSILENLKSKLQEKFVVKKSIIRLKLQFEDEKTAKEVYTKLKEVISSKNIATLAHISEPTRTMETVEINIRNADAGVIEALFSIKFRRFPLWGKVAK